MSTSVVHHGLQSITIAEVFDRVHMNVNPSGLSASKHRKAYSRTAYANSAVTSACCNEVEGWMHGHGIDGAQVPVVVPHNLVLLEVPALDLGGRRETTVSFTDKETIERSMHEPACPHRTRTGMGACR